jgi:hypothetical protein
MDHVQLSLRSSSNYMESSLTLQENQDPNRRDDKRPPQRRNPFLLFIFRKYRPHTRRAVQQRRSFSPAAILDRHIFRSTVLWEGVKVCRRKTCSQVTMMMDDAVLGRARMPR